MPYGQPESASKFTPSDHPEWIGKLLLVYPTHVEDVQFKPDEPATKMVTADVAIVDLIDPQTGKPTVILGARIGSKALVPQLPEPGRNTAALGRLIQLPRVGEKSGAYKLDNYTPQDGQVADAFEASAGDWRGKFSQPSPTPAVATPGVSYAAPTPAPAAAPPVAAASPWHVADGALLGRVLAKGVPYADAVQLDAATAALVANG